METEEGMTKFEIANHITDLLLEGLDTTQIEQLLNISFLNIWEEVYELVLKSMKKLNTVFFNVRNFKSKNFELQLNKMKYPNIAFTLKFIFSNIIYQIGSKKIEARLTITPIKNGFLIGVSTPINIKNIT